MPLEDDTPLPDRHLIVATFYEFKVARDPATKRYYAYSERRPTIAFPTFPSVAAALRAIRTYYYQNQVPMHPTPMAVRENTPRPTGFYSAHRTSM
jgi:hypothetical protein